MKRKLLAILLVIVFTVASLPQITLAQTNVNSVVFLDADENVAINEIGTVKQVKAEAKFTVSEAGTVNVITACYSETGRLLESLLVEPLTFEDEDVNQVYTHETAVLDVTDAETIKLFVWTDTYKPVLTTNGILTKEFNANNYFEKFDVKAGQTAEIEKVIEEGIAISADEIFAAVQNAQINSKYFDVSAEAIGNSDVEMTFVPDATDWTKGTLTFSGTGTVKLTAQDYDFCIPAEAYVAIIEPIPTDEPTPAPTAEPTAEPTPEPTAEPTAEPTPAPTPAPVDRYSTKFVNNDKFLYRVGNRNAVSLSSLFAATDTPSGNVQVTVEAIGVKAKSSTVSGVYTANSSDWTKGTIKFSGLGIVKVTIKDDNSLECSILLEVIDAQNATTALISANSYDVVLLNDISGTFTVTNGHTFHGNGFTVTLPTSSVQNKGNGFTGYISIGASGDSGSGTGGNLDNVKIVGPVYPEMYIYRDQAIITDSNDPDYGDGNNMRYFKNSVIVYGGDCKITNSYISGSRSALYIRGGNNIVLENTTLSGGAYANLNVGAGISLTLRDVTTVQTDVADSYGKGKTVHGLGIAVGSDVTDIYIEGTLTQKNWLCKSQWDNVVPSNYQSSFPNFFGDSKYSAYWHYLNGGKDPYVNLALVFACNWDKAKIHDNRTNVDYATCDSTITGVAGGIYSKVNTSGGNAITNSDIAAPEYISTAYEPVAPVFFFDNEANADEDDANDAADDYCVYSDNELKIGMTGASKQIRVRDVSLDLYGIQIPYTVYFNGKELANDEDTVTVSFENGEEQLLEYKAVIDYPAFDASGNRVGPAKEYTWTVPISVAKLAYPAPVWNMGGDYQFDKTNLCYVYYSKNQGYGEAVPIYEGIKINYYNANGQLVNLDLSGTTAHPTGSANDNTKEFVYSLSDGSKLSMKFASGWKSGAITHLFATYKNKVYIYPQSLDNDEYVRAKTTNQDFDVKINYTFTDPNGQSITQTMRWYNPKADNGNVTQVQWKTFDGTYGKEPSTCVTGDTLVTLADGSYKRIDEVTYSDKLLVWNFYEGRYEEASSAIIFNHGYDNNTVIKLKFDDGTEVKAVNLHQFFCSEDNKFVTITEDNVADYLNKSFVKKNGNGYKTVKLTDYEVSKEYIEAYGIISDTYYNILVQDLFSTDFMEEDYALFNYFEVGENMMFDAGKLAKDIETYGTYSYEDFKDYVAEEIFEAFNIKYMKVSVGKGYYTFEGILKLIDEYLHVN